MCRRPEKGWIVTSDLRYRSEVRRETQGRKEEYTLCICELTHWIDWFVGVGGGAGQGGASVMQEDGSWCGGSPVGLQGPGPPVYWISIPGSFVSCCQDRWPTALPGLGQHRPHLLYVEI